MLRWQGFVTVIDREERAVLSDVVGMQIRAYRDAQGLTREQVAERCALSGWPSLTAAIVAYIELGRPNASGIRRREVSVDEVVALAYVLDVPPLALLAPPHVEPWAGIPGNKAIGTGSAAAWLRGERRLLTDGPDPQVYAEVKAYVAAESAAWCLLGMLEEWRTFDDLQARPEGWHVRFDMQTKQLRSRREQLRSMRVPCPALPEELQWIDRSGVYDE
jgi:transcriptional regulator with XRE-family HTH domain